MLEAHGKTDTNQKINEIKSSVNALQLESNKLYSELETIKKQRSEARKQTSALISETREIRKTRDALTSEVKAEKNKRSELNSQIKEKVQSVKILAPQGRTAQSATQLKHAISAINQKIETEVISFEKEKALMKQLHKLEKDYATALKLQAEFKQKKEISDEIRTIRSDADEVHAQVQEKAKLSQEEHEKAIANSKKIYELVKRADELGSAIDEKQKALDDVDFKLEAKLKELGALSGQIRASVDAQRKRKSDSIQKTLSQKRAEVEAKFKRGEKLTNQDLLTMQMGE